ncbi:chemotaxis protein CheD [Desulfovibrio aerotolerans]|uniref:Probable chemoreceptor glutamine deamidase CheD n=1 Tax=Solidesulfovibrio aerotolerans TaxID=295255 RepID=A0A7C9N3K6_9BACT|nr:chemotaxis protein CheD [Solidesulfovibrio aerotolerans]MYL81755.1 chemotaxis protein CheD [Solidesulfovibrio aerotolerans]
MQGLLDRFPNHKIAFLNVAQGILVDKPTVAHTVLGSCVSVTFFAPRAGLGAIFHALLPKASEYRLHAPDQTPYKFVDTAIELLVARFVRRGVPLHDIECKVFGGASALFAEEMSVGRKNVEIAFATLSDLGLRVAASNVGGDAGRKIVFSTSTGEIFVRMLKNSRKK